nr:arginyl tRNA synthetase [Hymenolepis microstoma]
MRKPHTEPQRVLVEFSSINIAKPMHMGHFRATVLGNFVKNINLAARNVVTSVNYLGDWGTQFGLLSLGFENYGDPDLLASEPLKHLHSVYVRACQSMDSSEGKSVASALATQMEIGQRPDLLELWSKFRELSLKELQHLYARMNVHFDHYEYESDFVPSAKALIELLIKQRICRREEDGSVSAGSSEPGKRVTLLKSDGGTLYLTRDLAAAISRFENFDFDRMHYVVEDGQREHFLNLAHLLSSMGYEWAKPNSSPWPLHVRFARVSGASTRRGNGLFLVDVLDAAKNEARQRMLQSPNTRISPSDGDLFESVSDQMGVTWLISEMLRRPRMQPVRLYLRFKDDYQSGRVDSSSAQSTSDSRDLTGLGLQYCHARLCSLEEKAMASGLLPNNSDINSINEMLLGAFNAIPSNRPSREVEEEICAHLALFPDVLTCAYVKYEADGLLRFSSRLTPVAKYGFYVDPYTHGLQVSHRNQLNRESMLFVCVLEEPPDPSTGRGASFYELHEVHIHPSELDEAQVTPNNLEVFLTFETVAYDPFPPVLPRSTYKKKEDKSDPKVREPWKDPEENLLDNPISKLRQWSPLLRFRFSDQNIDCDKLKYMFDVTTTIQKEGRQGELRDWARNSELSTFSEFLSTFYWRKQDRPHSMYYAPVFCAAHLTDWRNSFGEAKSEAYIYPFRGFTLVWYAKWLKPATTKNRLFYTRVRTVTIYIKNAKKDFISMAFDCTEGDCKMDFELKVGSINGTKSTYRIPGNQSLLQAIETQSSTFALILDGPEFILDSRNLYYRRLRLICDGWTVMTAAYSIPGSIYTYMKPDTFATSAVPFYESWGDPFKVIIRVNTV